MLEENTYGMYFDKASNTFKTRQRVSQNSSNRAVENNERSDEGVAHLIEVSDSQITNLNSQVNWLTRQVQDLNGKMVLIFARIEEQDLSLKECNSNVARLNSQIDDLTKQGQDLNSKSSEQKRLTKASNKDLMTFLERQQKEQQERLENREKEQSAQITDLVGQIQNLNSKMSSIYEEIYGDQKQLTETFNGNLTNLMEKQKERERLEKEESLRLSISGQGNSTEVVKISDSENAKNPEKKFECLRLKDDHSFVIKSDFVGDTFSLSCKGDYVKFGFEYWLRLVEFKLTDNIRGEFSLSKSDFTSRWYEWSQVTGLFTWISSPSDGYLILTKEFIYKGRAKNSNVYGKAPHGVGAMLKNTGEVLIGEFKEGEYKGSELQRAKEWYQEALLKEIERIERSIRDLSDRVLSNETEGADEAIQVISKAIDGLKNYEGQSSAQDILNVHTEEGPSKAEVEGELSISMKEFEMAQNRLNREKLNKELKLAEAEETGTELSKNYILAGEFRMRVKELEVSHLESTLKKRLNQRNRNTADNNVINSVSDPKVSCVQQ
ncbi:hypothetical protein H8356DRAFT_1426502 [Neocallimastix lanati (nom. inval.)]|nr:hypothetical protein H8356DRAFT_1426502 [Neocallimastix sp. JGI-2020a]